jgi:hypothetical protein
MNTPCLAGHTPVRTRTHLPAMTALAVVALTQPLMFGTPARAPGSLAGWLWRLRLTARPGAARLHRPRGIHQRRYYPPQRDRVVEQAAMAREMHRL